MQTGMTEGPTFCNFEGYGSVFNVIDNANDLILPGAYKLSLIHNPRPRFLLHHNVYPTIGEIEEIYEDNHGLFIKGTVLTKYIIPRGLYHIFFGDGLRDGLSIGFRTLKSELREDGVRILQEIDLHEISVVDIPMNLQARLKITTANKLGIIAEALTSLCVRT